MSGIDFTLIVVAFLNLILGSTIYIRGRRGKSTSWYGFCVALVAWWASSVLFFRTASDPTIAYYWLLSTYTAPAFVTYAFLMFTIYFPFDKSRTSTLVRRLSLGGLIVVIAVILSPGFIQDVHITVTPRTIVFGPWPFFAYITYTISYLLWAFWNIIQVYHESPKDLRRHALFIAIGAAITAFAGITTGLFLPLFGHFGFFWAGAASTVFLFVMTGYAITRFQLLNVKVVAVEVMTILIEIILVLDIFLSNRDNLFDILFRTAVAIFVGVFGFFLTRSVHKEISTRRQIEDLTQELRRTNTELQKLDEAKSEFLAIASHQLRTPLSAIKGFISLILEGMYGKPTHKERITLGKVYESNERLVKLVNDLLDVSKIEAGGFKYEWQRTDLAELVTSVVSEIERNALVKGLTIRFEEPPRLPPVTADSSKLRQVIINVIDNAIRYTDTGGITVRLKDELSSVLVSIHDTGIGLAREEIADLFQKYARGKTVSRTREGTGLGLYVARRIVEDHHGTIWVESAGRGHGSTFFIRLPIQGTTEAARITTTASSLPVSMSPFTSHPVIGSPK